MNKREISLYGKICPYPVVEIVYEVDRMREGEECHFLVDDPLAIKSVPEELEDYDDIAISIDRIEKGWEIGICKE